MDSKIGPYTIESELGRGGMGVVYRAHDGRLDRTVAIKALPPALAADPGRLDRFQREARVLAQLNHPNLTGIYGLEEHGGATYLVLEFVEGETLADRLDRGPLPVDDAVEIAAQIAAGLEAAHEAGVIHRDLKPANVMITPDGQAKVLDFGLARADEGQSTSTVSEAATMTSPAIHSPTVPGIILGTAAYMSPEQARGRRTDKRTDIWSFGVVLYEMLTGSSPFVGETVSDSIGAILHKDPPLDRLHASTPASVHRVLDRCLERDKSQRYRDIGDVRLELLRRDDGPHAKALAPAPGSRRMVVVATALVVAGVAGTAGWFGAQASLPQPERVVRKLEIYSAEIDDKFNAASPQISPDGMKIAFIQNDTIMLRDLSSFDTKPLAEAAGARRLVWSRDGQSIVYSTTEELRRIQISSGAETRIGNFVISMQMAWDDTDRIVFSDDARIGEPGISAVPARGGTAELIYAADPAEVIDFHAITAIPGTDVLLLVRHRTDQDTPIEAWDGERFVVIADFDDQYSSAPVWSPSGHVVFARGYGRLDLWAVPFSPERMEVTGDPFMILADASAPSFSEDGTLSCVRGSIGTGGEMVWIVPDGSIESIGDGGALVRSPLVSPDASRIAYAGGSTPNDLEIWVRDLGRGINTRISNLEGFMIPVAWSPDGREIAVMNFDPTKGTEGQQTIFLAADGTGPTREPYPGLLAAFDAGWTRAVRATDPRSGSTTLSVVDLSDMSGAGDIIDLRGAFLFVSISPDGEHLLYSSRDSGEMQIYCTRFPSGEGRWQVSSDGGDRPQWSPDGSTVYYTSSDNEFMQVDVTRDPTLRFGIPSGALPDQSGVANFDSITPAPGADRFVAVRGNDDDTEQAGYQLLLIENWFEAFRDSRRR